MGAKENSVVFGVVCNAVGVGWTWTSTNET